MVANQQKIFNRPWKVGKKSLKDETTEKLDKRSLVLKNNPNLQLHLSFWGLLVDPEKWLVTTKFDRYYVFISFSFQQVSYIIWSTRSIFDL